MKRVGSRPGSFELAAIGRRVRPHIALLMLALFSWTPKLQAQQAAPADTADSAEAAEEVARQHFQLGRAQYAGGNFKEAAESFQHAYQLSKREVLWYNIYLAYRDLGDNEKAAEALRYFLTRVPEVDNRAQLEARLASLERLVQEELARRKQEEDLRHQAAAEQAQAPQHVDLKPAANGNTGEEPHRQSVVPYVLMGSGGALIVGGVVFGVMSSSKYSELQSKCPNHACDPSLKSTASQGKTFALVSDVLMFGGIGLAATGGVLWILNRSSHSESEPRQTFNFNCGPHACGAQAKVIF